jgi:hypothetical protein
MAGFQPNRINQHKDSHHRQPAAETEHQQKPFRLEDADVMDLQRQIGNQATQAVLGVQRKAAAGLPSVPGVVQTKMTVNEPGDQYEQEADQVAHEVMTMPDPVQREAVPEEDELMQKPLQREAVPEEDELMQKPLQREAVPEEDELMQKPLQREAVPEEDELMQKPIQREAVPEEDELAMPKRISSIQRDSAAAVPAVSAEMENQINQAKGSGQPLPESARNFMENRFGQDFSQVRVHTGTESHELNNSLQARAFTTGSDIFFREGEYNPESGSGKELLAHELTHVVQQGGSSELKTKKEDDSR